MTARIIRRPALALMAIGLLPSPLILIGLSAFSASHEGEAFFVATLASLWAVACTVYLPRRLFRRIHRGMSHRPVTAEEVAGLLPNAQDELERAYLTLSMDVIRQEIAPVAEADLRSALRALGDAIDRLPATRVVSDSTDIMTEVLRRTAAEALAAAQAEPDRVVAASQIRRAEALQRRADATHRAAQLVRRFGALRQEMAAETEALRAGLAAYYTGANDIADLTRLSEDIRRVAAEAAAITAARDEMDEFIASTPYTAPVQPEARLNLERG